MISRPRIEKESEIVQLKILCFLHYRYAHSEAIIFTINELMDAIKENRFGVVKYSCDALLSIERVILDGSDYHISNSGISEVESWDDDAYSEIAESIDFSDEEETSHTLEGSTEFAEQEWLPLKIDRESKVFRDVIEQTEAALKAIEGDNGYAASEPEERNQVVWSLSEGLAAMKERLPTKAQINALVIAPLRYIGSKFAGTIIGEAAKNAWPAIVNWLSGL